MLTAFEPYLQADRATISYSYKASFHVQCFNCGCFQGILDASPFPLTVSLSYDISSLFVVLSAGRLVAVAVRSAVVTTRFARLATARVASSMAATTGGAMWSVPVTIAIVRMATRHAPLIRLKAPELAAERTPAISNSIYDHDVVRCWSWLGLRC